MKRIWWKRIKEFWKNVPVIHINQFIVLISVIYSIITATDIQSQKRTNDKDENYNRYINENEKRQQKY